MKLWIVVVVVLASSCATSKQGLATQHAAIGGGFVAVGAVTLTGAVAGAGVSLVIGPTVKPEQVLLPVGIVGVVGLIELVAGAAGLRAAGMALDELYAPPVTEPKAAQAADTAPRRRAPKAKDVPTVTEPGPTDLDF